MLSPTIRLLTMFLTAWVLANIIVCQTALGCEEGPIDEGSPNSVTVHLDGGQVSRNIASVYLAALKFGIQIPTKSVQIKDNKWICRVLTEQGYPASCDDLMPVIRALNADLPNNLTSLHDGVNVCFPAIPLELLRSEKIVHNDDDSRNKITEQARAWSDQNPRIFDRSASEKGLEYTSYKFKLAVPNEDAARKLYKDLIDLRLANVAYSYHTASPAIYHHYAFPSAADIQSDCKNNNIVTAQRYYKDLDAEDKDAEAIPDSAAADTEPVTVHIIDTNIANSPNLAGALIDAPPSSIPNGWKCKWAFDEKADHGTFIASIIASQSNGTGFVGVAPDVRLMPVDLAQNQPGDVAAHIRSTASPLDIFLFASGIPLAALVSPVDGRLADSSIRFQDYLAKTIKVVHPLVIAAAGQPSGGNPIGDLDGRYGEEPQNLGDLSNVLVVTACEDCSGTTDTIWKSANISSGDWKFVHVAAPGGSPIAAWTRADAIGAGVGTSPAAAYVAAIAARMIHKYPRAYTSPEYIKLRLQVCSRPLPVFFPNMTENPGIDHLAVGVVDEAVCLLDPTKTWVKSIDGWTPKNVRAWGISTGFWDSSGPQSTVYTTGDILRIVKSFGPGTKGTWTVYADRSRETDAWNRQVDGGVGSVKLRSQRTPTKGTSIVMCSGEELSIGGSNASVTDIILPLNRDPHHACK